MNGLISGPAIHLPHNNKLVGALRQIAFGVNLIAVILLGMSYWLGARMPIGAALLFLIIAGTTLFHATENSGKRIQTILTIIPVTAGIFVSLCSIYIFFFTAEDISFYTLLSFIFTGLAIAIPYIKTLIHRFHPAQFLAFMTLIPNLMAVFGTFNTDFTVFYISLLFVLVSMAILLRWPGRGFMGIFTTDSASSSLALKLVLSILLLVPVIGFLIMIWQKVFRTSMTEVIAVITISITTIFTILIWLDTRWVYKTELENFLMKEELKEHNINLKLNNQDLAEQIQNLENTKRKYAATLNYQDRYRDIAEGLG